MTGNQHHNSTFDGTRQKQIVQNNTDFEKRIYFSILNIYQMNYKYCFFFDK